MNPPPPPQESIHDAFVECLVARVRKLRLGSGLDPATTHGPVITPAALDRVEDKVADAVAKGATVAVGGARAGFDPGDPLSKGYYFQPTVLTGAQRGWG